MKKRIMLLVLLSAFLLVGCSDEESGVNNLDEVTDATLNIEDGATEAKKIIKVNENEIEFTTSYKIENAKGWKFTHTAEVDLSITLEQNIDKYDIKIGAVYADISIVSKKAKYHGLRQDSIFVEYKELNNDGISLSQQNGYQMPFIVEGINQNEVFLTVYNGTGYGTSERLTESKVSDVAYGASLNVVWTLYITDKETNQTYMKSVNDKIGLPVKQENIETNQ